MLHAYKPNQTKPNRTEPFQIHLIWYMHDEKRDKCENETWHRFIALHLSWTVVSMVGHFLPKRWIYNIVMDTVCAMATIEHWPFNSIQLWAMSIGLSLTRFACIKASHTPFQTRGGEWRLRSMCVCVSTMYVCKWHHQLSTWHYLSPVFIINVFND